ncbi:hypothetical protein OF83DRAFT_1088834 [Amylostereum chailletii]|nr:hypothetical protein OF83DRAFT_1088834 [Amylostereum chailletii]
MVIAGDRRGRGDGGSGSGRCGGGSSHNRGDTGGGRGEASGDDRGDGGGKGGEGDESGESDEGGSGDEVARATVVTRRRGGGSDKGVEGGGGGEGVEGGSGDEGVEDGGGDKGVGEGKEEGGGGSRERGDDVSTWQRNMRKGKVSRLSRSSGELPDKAQVYPIKMALTTAINFSTPGTRPKPLVTPKQKVLSC